MIYKQKNWTPYTIFKYPILYRPKYHLSSQNTEKLNSLKLMIIINYKCLYYFS